MAEDTGHQCGSNENQVVNTDQSGTMNIVVQSETVSDQVGTKPTDQEVQKDQSGTMNVVVNETCFPKIQLVLKLRIKKYRKIRRGAEHECDFVKIKSGTEPAYQEVPMKTFKDEY